MQEYIAILEQYGIYAFIIAVLLSIGMALLKQWLANTTLFTLKHLKQSQLTKHSFFSTMAYWRKIGIDGIEIRDPAKARLVKDYLHIQFRLFDIMVKDIVADGDTQTLSQQELKYKLTTQVTDAVCAYEQEARQLGMPELFIKKFAKWHRRSLIFLMKGIGQHCVNTYYNNNTERFHGVLGVFLVTFNATIIDAEHTLNDINGDLKGFAYKGKVIGD